MEFRNPVNGHVEERSAPWLWTLLFGGFYFIAVGLWGPLLIWMILTLCFYAWLGASGTILVIIMNVVYAALSSDLVRSSYLRKSWVEVDGWAEAKVAATRAETSQGLRKCPFCAEEIKVEAVKCKHCGSAVELVEHRVGSDDALQTMEALGVSFDGSKYCYGDYRYDKLIDALAYAKSQEPLSA